MTDLTPESIQQAYDAWEPIYERLESIWPDYAKVVWPGKWHWVSDVDRIEVEGGLVTFGVRDRDGDHLEFIVSLATLLDPSTWEKAAVREREHEESEKRRQADWWAAQREAQERATFEHLKKRYG